MEPANYEIRRARLPIVAPEFRALVANDPELEFVPESRRAASVRLGGQRSDALLVHRQGRIDAAEIPPAAINKLRQLANLLGAELRPCGADKPSQSRDSNIDAKPLLLTAAGLVLLVFLYISLI